LDAAWFRITQAPLVGNKFSAQAGIGRRTFLKRAGWVLQALLVLKRRKEEYRPAPAERKPGKNTQPVQQD
jgi:hypothetical protein